MSALVISNPNYVGKRRRPENALSTQRLPRLDANGEYAYVSRHAKLSRKEMAMARKKHWTEKVARAFWRTLYKLGVIDND